MMPFTGGRLYSARAEAAALKRKELETQLRNMEERYARYQRADLSSTPDAQYLKQCIDDAKHVLRGK